LLKTARVFAMKISPEMIIALILLAQLVFGKRAIMSVSEELDGIKLQLRKAKIEIGEKLADLNANIVNLEGALATAGNADPAVTAALEEVKVAAQEIDDIVPDVVDTPVEPAPVVDTPVDAPVETPVVDAPVDAPVDPAGDAPVE
jgi:hypothetical protein